MPGRQRSQAIPGGALNGMRIVNSWHDDPAPIFGYAEPGLTSCLLQTVGAGETGLDVAAHSGHASVAMYPRVGKEGRVFAFEPSLSTVARLEWMRRENGFDPLSRKSGVRADISLRDLLEGCFPFRLPVPFGPVRSPHSCACRV